MLVEKFANLFSFLERILLFCLHHSEKCMSQKDVFSKKLDKFEKMLFRQKKNNARI